MQKGDKPAASTGKVILYTLLGVFLFFFIVLPIGLFFLIASFTSPSIKDYQTGNVALIPIEGVITTDGTQYFGQPTASSKTIIEFIEEASKDAQIEAIVLEINSPGGSAVASDEIATAVKSVSKPVVAYIREVGASGGYWVASSTDYIVAQRMSITGSIGVISSYLEFSGLMDEYGVGYEKLIAGKYKDIGTPFRKLQNDERTILQGKLNLIHDFFIEEVAQNRKLPLAKVQESATGEFFLGVEAKKLGLVDVLGNKDTVKSYLEQQGIKEPSFTVYEKEPGFFEFLTGVTNTFSFQMGRGIGSMFIQDFNKMVMI